MKITFLTLCFSLNILADSTRVNPYRLGVVLGATAGVLTLAHIQQYNSWWKGELTKFHFKDDFNHVLNADKFGHAYFSFVISDLFGRSLEWAGVKKDKATLYGAVAGLIFQTYVEVEDGFRPSLGFSVSDEISNFIGAFLPFFKEKFPALKALNFKMSVFPSEKFKSGAHRFIVDDYESLYFWLCFDVAEILKLKQLKFWAFDMFDVAIGYSVKEIDWKGNGRRELFLSLDYDLSKIPAKVWFLKQILHLFNYYHLPAPTLQITPRLKFFIVKI